MKRIIDEKNFMDGKYKLVKYVTNRGTENVLKRSKIDNGEKITIFRIHLN